MRSAAAGRHRGGGRGGRPHGCGGRRVAHDTDGPIHKRRHTAPLLAALRRSSSNPSSSAPPHRIVPRHPRSHTPRCVLQCGAARLCKYGPRTCGATDTVDRGQIGSTSPNANSPDRGGYRGGWMDSWMSKLNARVLRGKWVNRGMIADEIVTENTCRPFFDLLARGMRYGVRGLCTTAAHTQRAKTLEL